MIRVEMATINHDTVRRIVMANRHDYKIILTTAIIILIFIVLVLISVLDSKPPFKPQANKGILNLSQNDFKEYGNLKLDGEWEFYWNKLISYQDPLSQTPDLYADIPDTWNEYSLHGERLSGEGYATYRLHVVTDLAPETTLGLRIYTLSSAYNIFINEKKVASRGKVSANPAEETGEYGPQAIFFSIPDSEFDMIVHVSNHQYARGGFWYGMFLGYPEQIMSLHEALITKEFFLIGALLMISLFFFAVYFLRKELRYTLIFAFLCLWVSLLVDMVGQFVLLKLFPSLSFNTVILFWYSSTEWVLFFLIWYVHELYPSKFSRLVLKVSLIYACISQLLFVLTPPLYYTRSGQITNYLDIVLVLCSIIIVGIGIKKNQSGGWLNILSMMVVLVTYIHDIGYWTNIIRTPFGEIFYFGLFLFLFIQLVIQAQRIKLFHEQKTAAELQFLQAQIKPHFLYNALNTVISISRYDIEQSRILLADFSKYLRRSFDFEDLSQFVPLRHEIELAQAYTAIEKARFEERLEVVFNIPDNLEIRVPVLILQPLIENAVIHGILPKSEGGKIQVSITEKENGYVFTVKDNGVGMNPIILSLKKDSELKKSVGLHNIDKRLKNIFGSGLEITSTPEVGTQISWFVPKATIL